MNYIPSNFDVVNCSFPYGCLDDGSPIPGPDKHPCLVVGVEESDGGVIFIFVVFGTSKTNKGYSSHALILSKSDGFALEDAGLEKDTMFDLKKTARLKFDKRFFPDITATSSRRAKEHCRFGCLNEVARRKLRDLISVLRSEGWNPENVMFGNGRKKTHKHTY